MTNAAPPNQEYIGYRRSAALPGFEVIDAYHSSREWRAVGDAYAVTVPLTWRGQAVYRGLKHVVRPGVAFCNHPDELFVANPEAGHAGSFNVLVIHPGRLDEWLFEQRARTVSPEFAAITKPMSGGLMAKFRRLFAAFEPGTSAMELQSNALELSESMIRELIADGSNEKLKDGPAIRGTARMRECLNEEGLNIDLETLASRAGLSRFQALRAFKRRYGLPPHAYQLCLRVSRVRRLLLAGAPPADVAVQCGFVDQSHMNRHFKRLVGVTPMQYAQANAASRLPFSGVAGASAPLNGSLAALANHSDWRRAP